MNTNNNINNENNENKTFMQKVNGFIKNHKIPTIATACVLVLAIGAGVIFGVTNHNGTTGKFPTFSDSESDKTDLDVPAITDDDTSSDDVTSSDETDASEVVSQTPTPNDNKNNTVSKEDTPSATISTPETISKTESTTSSTTSKPSGSSGGQGSGSSTPTTSTPSTSTPTTSTPSTSTTPSTPSDSSSDDAGLEGKDWFYETYYDGTTGEPKQCRCYYVTIGQLKFLVNYDAVYGICKKCGLNDCAGGKIWTCSGCGYSACATTFCHKDYNYPLCPCCLTEYKFQ